MTTRQVAYLYVPDFGATVARRADRAFEKQPLVLVDEQNQVLSADARAMQAGIAPGMSKRQAMTSCPEAAVVPAARFPLWEAQDLLWQHVKRYTDCWQPEQLGCLYLDASKVGHSLLGWCQAVLQGVKRLGWQPALGATGSKFGAWVAAQQARKQGHLLLPQQQRTFLAAQPITLLPLDLDAQTYLRHLGVRTLAQFTRLPLSGIITRFGPVGKTAYQWAQGLDDRPVVPPWEAPEVSARIEFDPPVANREHLLPALTQRAQKLLVPLQERLQAVNKVALAILRADKRLVQGSHIFAVPTNASERINLGLASALDKITWDNEPGLEATLTLSGIMDAPHRQLTLFDFDQDNRGQLQTVLEQLVIRFGQDVFRLATLVEPDNLLLEHRVVWRRFN